MKAVPLSAVIVRDENGQWPDPPLSFVNLDGEQVLRLWRINLDALEAEQAQGEKQ